MHSIDNRKSIIYTSGLLDKLYNLKSSNIKCFEEGNSYTEFETTANGVEISFALCTEEGQAYILNSNEILLLDILFCWKELLYDESSESAKDAYITLKEIDWTRNRHKTNKEHIAKAHKLYLLILTELDKLYLLSLDSKTATPTSKHKIIKYELVTDADGNVAIKYNFGNFGDKLKNSKMMTTIYGNIFKFRLNEDMKYRILRYLIISIFMNRTKHKEFCRSHKSILKGITKVSGVDKAISYFDYFMMSDHINKYLKRYLTRLKEVLELLKSSNYIKDYTIENISNKEELMLGFGKVIISTNLSRKRKEKHISLS